jgi:hypothetical protein
MAQALVDLILPIKDERERKQYRFVLASQYPDVPEEVFWGLPEMLSVPIEIDPAELHEGLLDDRPMVRLKRIIRRNKRSKSYGRGPGATVPGPPAHTGGQ